MKKKKFLFVSIGLALSLTSLVTTSCTIDNGKDAVIDVITGIDYVCPDFIEIGELMAHDALEREESCGGHFRLEHQTEEGETLRDDEKFSYVSCWEYQGEDKAPVMFKEPLVYEFVEREQRNYKS